MLLIKANLLVVALYYWEGITIKHNSNKIVALVAGLTAVASMFSVTTVNKYFN